MRKLLFPCGMALASATPLLATSNLPECPATQTENYTNCHFVYVAENRQYIIEFKDPSRPGYGAGESSGIRIDGIWSKKERNGPGTITDINGDKLEGELKNGYFVGEVTFTESNGDKLVSGVRDGVSFGQATFIEENGDKLISQIQDGRLFGHVTIAAENQYFHVQGFWVNSTTILGTKIWKDGRIYSGHFEPNGNPRAFFSYETSVLMTDINNQLECGTASVEENYFKILEKRITPTLQFNGGGASGLMQTRLETWMSIFDGIYLRPTENMFSNVSTHSPKDTKREMENPFPMLSLVNTRTDRRNDAIKRIECSGDLVGNFGPLGTYRTIVQYVVQLTDDGNIYVSIPQR